MITRHSVGRERTATFNKPEYKAETQELQVAAADFQALAADSLRVPAESGRLSSLIVNRRAARELEEGRFPAWAARRDARFLFHQAVASNIILGFIGEPEIRRGEMSIRDRIFNLADFAESQLHNGRRPDRAVTDKVQSESGTVALMLAYRSTLERGDSVSDKVRPSDWHQFFEETAAAAESAAHFLKLGLPTIARTISRGASRQPGSIQDLLATVVQTIGSRHGFIGLCERYARNPQLLATLNYWSALDAAVSASGGPFEKIAAARLQTARSTLDSLRIEREPAIEEMFGLGAA